jgi:hypothetical protein
MPEKARKYFKPAVVALLSPLAYATPESCSSRSVGRVMNGSGEAALH